MSARTDQREAIAAALNDLESQPLADASRRLFTILGYKSDRRIPIATPQQFCEQLDPQGKLTDRERDALDQVNSLYLLFQLTNAELDVHSDLFDDAKAVQTTKMESYLFFAAELPPSDYTRTALSTLVRAVNKPLPMPALILFRYGDTVSLGIVHRRLHKRDQARDVLEKVTLIKDIAVVDPIRAHLDILNDFVLPNLDADFGVSNFVRLHDAWQKRLDSYPLSNNFYREIADWYFWAHHQVEDGTIQLPQHCDTEQEKSLFLIRLLTRVIFCWFLVEKRLIPTELFREHRVKALLKNFNPGKDPKKPDTASTYYHAILQNLFFGTLNMPREQRAFREKKKSGDRYDKNYGITNLWRYENDFRAPSDWLALATRVPFLNGGLFDCLDDKARKAKDNFILDGFSDNPKLRCELPNDLFFGPDRTVDLSHDYGEESRRTARSKKAKVRGLIEILSHYKFTIEENTPLEKEIALDPELLGKVFENLLASYNEDTRTTARKALGGFYTPREIVSYMVDEALKAYLVSQVPRCKGALDDLFSNKATLRDPQPSTRNALIAAIARVKILDPACGSGAFPMGALHRLVDLLRNLDEDNDVWRELQRRRAIAETELAFQSGDRESREHRLQDINNTFEFNSSDYGRKLYLIENCIYGVDIQPIATQIAKLRFFISLIVDQRIDPRADNLGVRPLPNLETRLVAADTLIPIAKAESDLFSSELDKLRAELAAIRHEHFNARDPRKKLKWREADAAKRMALADLLKADYGLPRDSARKLAAWDPYDQNTFAPFFDSEWMFGLPVGNVRIEGKAPATLLGNLALINEARGQSELVPSAPREIESGFDIVIGNPPYVRIQTLKKNDPKLVAFFKDHYASAAKGNYDLYVVFIEAGLRLLKSDGHLAYICPHKFFNTEYGEPLRRMIAHDQSLRHVIHFGTQQVFPGATNYVCLLFLSKTRVNACRWLVADALNIWLQNPNAGNQQLIAAERISADEWNFSDVLGDALLERLRKQGTRLLDLPCQMSRGSSSGDDTVFVIDRASTNIEAEVLRIPVFATDFKRWAFNPNAKKQIIYPYRHSTDGVDLISEKELRKRYPKCFKYLVERKGELEARKGYRAWYGYSAARNLELHDRAQILVPLLAAQPSFAAIPRGLSGMLCPMASGGFSITLGEQAGVSPECLLGLLNSSVLFWILLRVSNSFRGGWITCTKQYFGELPIIRPSNREERGISAIVRLITSTQAAISDHSAARTTRDLLILAYWERLLNGLAYELYFPDEVHGAELQLFDLVERVVLPDLDAISDSKLSQLRQLFETLYDGAHPLRIALDKLQTLDAVRIIEDKA